MGWCRGRQHADGEGQAAGGTQRRLVGNEKHALKHLDEERRAVPQHIEPLAVRRRVQSRQVVGVHRRLRIENAELLKPQMVHHHEASDGVHAQRHRKDLEHARLDHLLGGDGDAARAVQPQQVPLVHEPRREEEEEEHL